MRYGYKMVNDVMVVNRELMKKVLGVEVMGIDVNIKGNARPELAQIMREIKQGDIIKVERLGDIARDVDDFLMTYEKILRTGAMLNVVGYDDVMIALIDFSKEKKKMGRPKKDVSAAFEECHIKWVNKEISVKEFMELFGYKTRDALYKQISRYERANNIDRDSLKNK